MVESLKGFTVFSDARDEGHFKWVYLVMGWDAVFIFTPHPFLSLDGSPQNNFADSTVSIFQLSSW